MEALVIGKLFVAYFLSEQVSHLTVFNCWAIDDQMKLVKYANENNLMISVIDLSKRTNYEYLLNRTCAEREVSISGIALDNTCNRSLDIINAASLAMCFNQGRSWFIYTLADTNITKIFNRINLFVGTQLTVAKPLNAPNRSVRLYDVYNNAVTLGGMVNITSDRDAAFLRDTWSFGRSKLKQKAKYDNRCEMRDITFTVVTVIPQLAENPHLSEEEILSHLSSINNTYINTYPRYGYNFIVLLHDVLKFKLKWIHHISWTYNDSGGGAFGEVLNDNAQMCVSPFMIKRVRMNYLSSVIHCGYFKSMFIFRNMHNDGVSGSIYLAPFSRNVWIAVIFLILASSILLKIVFTIECWTQITLKFIPSWVLTTLYSLGAVCQQGSSLVPSTVGGRTAFLALFLSSVILYNYYTSAVVSSLLAAPRESSIKNIVQLAESKLEIGIEKIGYTLSYLYNVHLPKVEYLVKKKVRPNENSPNLWINPELGIMRVRKGGYAYHCASGTAYTLIENYFELPEICDLVEVELLPKTLLGMIVKKDSPLREILRIKYLRMLEAGIQSKHLRYWIKEKPRCLSNNLVMSVGIEYSSALFFLLCFGFIFSLAVLIIEILVARNSQLWKSGKKFAKNILVRKIKFGFWNTEKQNPKIALVGTDSITITRPNY